MHAHEREPVQAAAPAPDTTPGPSERIPRLLLPRSPLGFLVRRVAGIRASVHAKLLGAFLLIALLLIAMGALSLRTITSVSRQSRLLDQARERVDASRQIEQTLGLQMNVTRNALLLRDDATIENILREKNRFDETLARLEEAASPDEREVIQRIRAVRGQVLTMVARIGSLIREGKHDEAMALHLGESAPLHREIATLVTRVVRNEETGMVRLRQNVEAANHRALLLTGGFAAASIVLALALGFVTSWSFILPVRQAEAFLARVATGDFSATIDVPNRDEFGVLAGRMNQMSRELHQLSGEQRRLFAELEGRNREITEALEQQTATADILRAISGSPTDIQPVLDTVVRAAARFCGATDVAILRLDGHTLRGAAGVGPSPDVIARQMGGLAALEIPVTRGSVTGRAVVEKRTVHVHDLATEPEDEFPEGRDLQRRLGHHTMVATPLLREGTPLGVIALFRMVVDPFSDKQLGLLRVFADQAAIAIENVRLFTELETRNRDLTESLEQQTATSEILRIISTSPTDLQPVLETVAANAARLCAADDSHIWQRDGATLHRVASWGGRPVARQQLTIGRRSVVGRAAHDRAPVHVEDLAEAFLTEFPDSGAMKDLGYRTILAVPLLREGAAIGVIMIRRTEVRPFTDKQIALVKTFADQAVIAIENVRLFKELETRNRDLTETLEQQTATGEILRVISSSPTDVQPVFDTIAQSAKRLCDAQFCQLYRFDGTLLHFVAHAGLSPEGAEAVRRAYPMAPGRASAAARSVLSGVVEQVPDVDADPDYGHGAVARTVNFQSVVGVPMVRDGVPIGSIAVARVEAGAFPDRQLELLKTFADQAVIAIENVRLFKELEVRNRDLTETLEQQTATSEILRVISSSPTDIQPVFDTIARSAAQLCEAQFCHLFRFDGKLLHFVAHHGLTPEGVEAFQRAFPVAPDRGSSAGRAALSGTLHHIPDVHADPDYRFGELARFTSFRSIVAVPMVRESRVIGTVNVGRAEAGHFSERQLDLLKTFADQAVIAIENVRLFKELEARNAELTGTLARQTATGEVLRAISRAQTDAQPVFDIIAASALRLCSGGHSGVWLYDGELIHLAALENVTPEGAEAIRRDFPKRADERSTVGRAILARAVAQIPDVLEDPAYGLKSQARTAGFRSFLAAPMLRDGEPIGVIGVGRSEPGSFPDTQIELLRTFADQAVIAIENVRLFRELEARNRDLTETLEQQTATGEILRVISSSPTDTQPVFETIARNAARLCEARDAVVYLVDGDVLTPVARHGPVTAGPVPLVPGTLGGRTVLERRTMHVADMLAETSELPVGAAISQREGTRSMLSVPLLHEDRAIGTIGIRRFEVRPFSDTHVALLQTFAAQAVIAIENVRLFKELEASTRDLTRSVGELKALGEVSQAVGSTLDLETVLETIVTRAVQLSGSDGGIVYEFEEASQSFHARATHRISSEHLEVVRSAPIRLGEGAVGRAGVSREPVQITDPQEEWQLIPAHIRALHVREGTRALLAVPLVREGQLLGGLVIMRHELAAFAPEVVATLQAFATQSVLAIHNAGLFREIQRRKQYADAIVETSPVAIVTVDLDGRVVGWNPGAERLFGHTEAESLGRPMEDLVATPEVLEEVRANIRRTLAGEWLRAIGRRARKDGTPVDVEISSVPVVVDGVQMGMIGIYHDITDLLRARREAEAANEAKSAFLATMSHEIRTPLNAVIGMSGLLLNTPLADEQREYAEIVRQSGDALLTVINDILDFSKIEAGKLELEAQPFDLRECVEGALDLVAARATEKGLDLAYMVGDGTPAVIVGDVTRLRQVLLNLLSNAVKFTERGEVVLSVAAHQLDGSGFHELTFAVRDTGIGIPPDRLGRLFQSFSQVDASTTRRYGGTGLGLAISQRLSELMGGRIGVTSEVGVGSEFRFTVRAVATAEGPRLVRRDLSGVQPSLRGKRVLVVDDNATNRRIVTTHLGHWGLPARATESPREALAWIEAREPFDVGILDMHMPEMDGIALARAIRQHAAGAELPLILFTSLGRREARAEEEGFAAYLHKPIKPSQLFDALVSVLADQPVRVSERGVARSELDPDLARRHPLRILLAEDNVVNQKVALRLLGQMGYRADVAGNGLEAIDAVERQAYDVVLMDVQMPELDGFEASREINRRWPGERRPRIVAMTANAMQGDRELCEAAGMDDYVAKPIRVEELVAALERSPRRPDSATRGAATGSGGGADPPTGSPGAPAGSLVDAKETLPAGAPAAAGVDPAAVERLTATMGAAFVAELIDTFAEDARGQVTSLRQAFAATDVDAFRRAAHSLKSTSETLGAMGLAELARELEAQARAGSLEGAAARLERLADTCETVTRTLGELRHDLPA
jgi:PAS domain S-box-containing protein